jgi:hypothetical protein
MNFAAALSVWSIVGATRRRIRVSIGGLRISPSEYRCPAGSEKSWFEFSPGGVLAIDFGKGRQSPQDF